MSIDLSREVTDGGEFRAERIDAREVDYVSGRAAVMRVCRALLLKCHRAQQGEKRKRHPSKDVFFVSIPFLICAQKEHIRQGEVRSRIRYGRLNVKAFTPWI